MSVTIPAPITKPFCNTGFYTLPPSAPASPSIVANQETGFPALQATPLSSGGQPVTIDQMNGVMYFYTQVLQALCSGGQYTFDQAVSDENGGYPADAILYSPTTNSFQRSLIDNNTFNFNTNPAYIDDQVHWSSDILIHGIKITNNIEFYNTAKTFYTSLAANPLATTNTNNFLPMSLPNSLGQCLTSDLAGKWSWFKNVESGIIGTQSGIVYNVSNAIPPPKLQLFSIFPQTYNVSGSPYDGTTNIFTAPSTGVYRLNLNLSLDTPGTSASVGQKFSIQPVINNVISSTYALGNFSYQGYLNLISGSITLDLSAGDTFYMSILSIIPSPCALQFSFLTANLSWNF